MSKEEALLNPIKRALVSVSDKSGLAEFARGLHELGVEVLSTGGTADLLAKAGVPVTLISDYTGFPEMMDGRIKTLHPKIHGGILAKRDVPAHQESMRQHDIKPIDLVAVNLYPFESAIARENCSLAEAIENIDIGGPAMLRSAAKNYQSVTALTDPADYEQILREMRENNGAVTEQTRLRLSRSTFAHTGRYDSLIAKYLSEQTEDETPFPKIFHPPFEKIQELRYGENPHQSAAFYREAQAGPGVIARARQLQGKELSFNNIIDLDAVWQLAIEFDSGSAAVVKHTNPCGVATGDDQRQIFIKARETDPVSVFGGIIGFNRAVTAQTAEEILKNFVEAVIAPGYEDGALELFAQKKNVRVMELPLNKEEPVSQGYDCKRVSGGLLVQSNDAITFDPDQMKVVTKRQPDEKEMEAMKFAWTVAKHVKSNAIVYSRENETVGIGAGQMNRIDSARLAVQKANKEVAGCVMASDAFFPFRDSIDTAAKSGIRAIIQPGGSIRDKEVIAAADEHDIAMVFTGIRHFKH